MEQGGAKGKRRPLLGAALMRRTLAARPGGLAAHKELYLETLISLGLKESDVDAYEKAHAREVEEAWVQAQGRRG